MGQVGLKEQTVSRLIALFVCFLGGFKLVHSELLISKTFMPNTKIAILYFLFMQTALCFVCIFQ
jgi:hypothetical protein